MGILGEYDGLKLTKNDVEKVNSIQSKELDNLRTAITLYKKNDKSYARFRMLAMDMIFSITIRTVLKKKLKKNQQDWLADWMNSKDTMVKDYMVQLHSNILKGI